MSWSISVVGRVPRVVEEVEKRFASNTPCAEPEESVRQAAKALITAALTAQDPSAVVRVDASGSQSTYGNQFNNNVNVKVEPLYGFVE